MLVYQWVWVICWQLSPGGIHDFYHSNSAVPAGQFMEPRQCGHHGRISRPTTCDWNWLESYSHWIGWHFTGKRYFSIQATWCCCEWVEKWQSGNCPCIWNEPTKVEIFGIISENVVSCSIPYPYTILLQYFPCIFHHCTELTRAANRIWNWGIISFFWEEGPIFSRDVQRWHCKPKTCPCLLSSGIALWTEALLWPWCGSRKMHRCFVGPADEQYA